MSYERKLVDYLSVYFDVETSPISYPPLFFKFRATYRQINQKYVFSKEWVYEECNNNEYIFFATLPHLPHVDDIKHCLTNSYKQMLNIEHSVNSFHMSSYITFIFEINSLLSSDRIAQIEKFGFYKSFLLGFKGWVNVKLIVINTKSKKGHANRFGKKDLSNYISII